MIAGNVYGIYVFDNAFYNIVQGNYVGLDVTGVKALPNGTGYSSGTNGGLGNSGVASAANTIGGTVPGAGNVISGNTGDGVLITGTSTGPEGTARVQTSAIRSKEPIKTARGTLSLGNVGAGVHLATGATSNLVGGTNTGAGNLITHNGSHGVFIDSGTAGGLGVANQTLNNAIVANGGAGVRVATGTGERISRNSIFGNAALGIDTDAAGENAISHCQTANTGANNLQNAPTLTAGTGNLFISATATDPGGTRQSFEYGGDYFSRERAFVARKL